MSLRKSIKRFAVLCCVLSQCLSVSCIFNHKDGSQPNDSVNFILYKPKFHQPFKPSDISFKVKKWYKGKAAAIAINYDAPFHYSKEMRQVLGAVVKRGMHMDLELYSEMYTKPPFSDYLETMRDSIQPLGIRFFGHGHTHVNHDALNYGTAFLSFKTDFDYLTQWGFDPKMYAYPGCYGLEEETQRANRKAGFLAARGCTFYNRQLVMEPKSAPDSAFPWYNMPSTVIGKGIPGHESLNESHEKVARIIDKTLLEEGFTILMYHSLGITGGFAWYPVEDFEKDLDYIRQRDIWNGNMESIVLYIKERKSLTTSVTIPGDSMTYWDAILKAEDNLDDHVYNQPLTLELSLNKNYPVFGAFINTANGLNIFSKASNNSIQFDIVPDGQELRVHFIPFGEHVASINGFI